MVIGVLAMQGAYKEHINILQDLDVSPVEIRNKNDLQNIDGIIIPGGESTTMGKLIRTLDIYDDLKEKIESGMPVWGTCAGMILPMMSLELLEVCWWTKVPITTLP